MKFKVCAVLVILSLIVFLPQVSFAKNAPSKQFVFVGKAGFDFMGEGEFEGDEDDIENGFSAAAEGLYNSNQFLFGGGASYIFPRQLDEDYDGKFSLLPIYAVVNVPFKSGNVTPFLTAQIGYNFLFIDSDLKETLNEVIGEDMKYTTKGGLYWGIGGGIILDSGIQFEILYTRSEGKIQVKNSDYDYNETYDLKYSKVTLSAGYRF